MKKTKIYEFSIRCRQKSSPIDFKGKSFFFSGRKMPQLLKQSKIFFSRRNSLFSTGIRLFVYRRSFRRSSDLCSWKIIKFNKVTKKISFVEQNNRKEKKSFQRTIPLLGFAARRKYLNQSSSRVSRLESQRIIFNSDFTFRMFLLCVLKRLWTGLSSLEDN